MQHDDNNQNVSATLTKNITEKFSGVNLRDSNVQATGVDGLQLLDIAKASTAITNSPSISSSAMLVEVSFSTWTGRKLDKRASQDVTRSNGADTGTANVNKKLLGECEELTAVQKFAANARNIHYSMTMPWSDTGMRLLPTAQYPKYHQAMTEFQNEFNRLAQVFINAYEWEISQAQARLGALFSHDDYPSADSIASKFGFRINYLPLPESGDFRVDVGNDARDQLVDHYNTQYGAFLERAMSDVWHRVYGALSKMSERLDYGDHEKKKIFRDSLVDNVLDMVDLLDVCNVTGDSQMSAMRLQLEDALRGVTPDALREDAFLRAETKRAVDSAIQSLPSLDI